MKAAVQTRNGPPEVVQVAEVDKPTARDQELLVKVHATTVNRTDCGFRAAKVQPGHEVLVNGATGAIGSASIQVCKQLGATVTAVCVGEHHQLVRDLGADRVIDYVAEDFTRDSQRYDMVHDAVGKSSFLRCWRPPEPSPATRATAR